MPKSFTEYASGPFSIFPAGYPRAAVPGSSSTPAPSSTAPDETADQKTWNVPRGERGPAVIGDWVSDLAGRGASAGTRGGSSATVPVPKTLHQWRQIARERPRARGARGRTGSEPSGASSASIRRDGVARFWPSL